MSISYVGTQSVKDLLSL